MKYKETIKNPDYFMNRDEMLELLIPALAQKDDHDFLEKLLIVIDSQYKTKKRLAKETGLCYSSFYTIFQEGRYPRFSSIKNILKSLGFVLTLEKDDI